MYSLYRSSELLTDDGTGLPQGTTTSSLQFTNSDSSGTVLPKPLVECFPLGGLSMDCINKDMLSPHGKGPNDGT